MVIKADSTKTNPLKSNSIDAIVTDSPYNLHFMGMDWDKNLLHEKWLAEAHRVLKPGGSMLVMGGTRTSHRLACAIEDTGFIIKDTLMWIYGGGFPKAQEASVLVDAKILRISTKEVKERRENVTIPLTPEGEIWNGFKIGGVKPAYEPIIWAVKSPEGAYVDNVLKHGVGAVNVDKTRINSPKGNGVWGTSNKTINSDRKFNASPDMQDYKSKQHNKGRFPANIMLSHHPECQQIGVKKIRGAWSNKGIIKNKSIFNANLGQNIPVNKDKYYDSDGYETIESWDCHPDCAVRILDEQSGVLKSGDYPVHRNRDKFKNCYGDFKGNRNNEGIRSSNQGGASRFFYCAKASTEERNLGLKGKRNTEKLPLKICIDSREGRKEHKRPQTRASNSHPTVKPIKLFEWLIKLVTREGQIVFDPFVGSGTTVIAALLSERKCVAIDNNSQYLQIAKARIEYWSKLPKQLEL